MDEIIINELVTGLMDIFRERLVSIILYGSVARKTNTNESDIDIAILLKCTKAWYRSMEGSIKELSTYRYSLIAPIMLSFMRCVLS